MKLYFKDIELGQITEVSADSPWIYGTIHLNEISHFMSIFAGWLMRKLNLILKSQIQNF